MSAKGAPDPDKQGSNFIMVRMVWSECMGGASQVGFKFNKWKGWWIAEGREEKRWRQKERERREEKNEYEYDSQKPNSRLES